MTPYRVYDCFINGRLFHSNDPAYNQILHGSAQPAELSQPHLFLQNTFHSAVTNLCLAAIGLKRYIDNGSTFADIVVNTKPIQALEFIFYRKKVTEMDEAYREANNDILAAGGESKSLSGKRSSPEVWREIRLGSIPPRMGVRCPSDIRLI